MICTKCGKTIEDNVRFCPYCGAEIDNEAKTREEENQSFGKEEMPDNEKEKVSKMTIREWGTSLSAVGVGIYGVIKGISSQHFLISFLGLLLFLVLNPIVLKKARHRTLLIIIGIIITAGMAYLMETQDNVGSSEQHPGYFSLNDTMPYSNENGGKGNLTITDWGTCSGDYGTILYIAVTFENVGDTDFYITSTDFSVYADNQLVNEFFMGGYYFEGEELITGTLSPGRITEGRIYYEINPEMATDIEVEVFGGKCILKNEEEQNEELKVENEAVTFIDFSSAYDTTYRNENGFPLYVSCDNDIDLSINIDDTVFWDFEIDSCIQEDDGSYKWYYGKGATLQYYEEDNYFHVETDGDYSGDYYPE